MCQLSPSLLVNIVNGVNAPGMLVKAEYDVLGRLADAPLVAVVCETRSRSRSSVASLTRKESSEWTRMHAPWPEMTACRFSTFAFSAAQNASSFPADEESVVACVEPEPRTSAVRIYNHYLARRCGRRTRCEMREDTRTVKPRIPRAVEVRLQRLDDMPTIHHPRVSFEF